MKTVDDNTLKRIYEYVKEAYKRHDMLGCYDNIKPWNTLNEKKKDVVEKAIISAMEYHKVNNAIELLEIFYHREDDIINLVQEEYHENY